jgi:RNA polymerase sigma-70 factor, ECF subfamily
MDEQDWLAQRFQEHRPHLRAVAYRMLGSLSEADDAVQETWLRLSRSEAGHVENLGAWLTTIVARVSLNMLRSRRSRREEPVGMHVPEPIVSNRDPEPGRAARVRAARHLRDLLVRANGRLSARSALCVSRDPRARRMLRPP